MVKRALFDSDLFARIYLLHVVKCLENSPTSCDIQYSMHPMLGSLAARATIVPSAHRSNNFE